MKTTTIDDFTVIIGGNAQENEDLIKCSAADDIWLHLENMSSAHIVIKANGGDVPKRVINSAAGLFAKFKKVTGRYHVIWTEIKNITLTKTVGCVVPKKVRTIRC